LPSNPEDISMLKYPSEFIRYITLLNLSLFFFNLIPAFPMDGGRVLRSLLAMVIGKYKATQVASYLGKGLAFVFIGLGIYSHQIFLGLIGVFVYFAAGAEYRSLRMTQLLRTTIAKSIMRKKFAKILPDTPLTNVVDLYIQGKEKNFVVVNSKAKLIGSIPEAFIQEAMKSSMNGLYATNFMSEKIAELSPEDTIYQIYHLFNKEGIAIGVVMNNEEIVGVVDRDIISEMIRKN
jgi:predicted transcriptional regulator